MNPYYEDSLNALLETYYARAEGFMLIGNDYMAKAYRHKFDRAPDETQPIVELEIEDISSALICYEIGFREFMKLFNSEFIGLSDIRKPHLDMDPEQFFFERRFPNPNGPGYVSFESLRGQKNAIGVSSRALNDAGDEIGPIQGSPNVEIEISSGIGAFDTKSRSPAEYEDKRRSTAEYKRTLSEKRVLSQSDQWNNVDAPLKLQLPFIEGSPTYEPATSFTLHFRIDAETPVKTVELVIEFDREKLEVPTALAELDFSSSAFSSNPEFYGPGTVYGDIQILANQVLIKAEAPSQITGKGISIVKVPFLIKSGQLGEFHIYAAGSAGSLLSGFKDIAILYRLAAAHANATAEKVRRLYNVGNQQDIQSSIDLIQEEIDRIGAWFEHIQALLNKAATPEELANIDQLQSAINQVSSALNGLSALREFIRSGANVFGYPDDYVPFYNADDVDTFDAVRNLVVGSGAFTPQTASGFFGTAREAETTAVISYDQFQDTKDRIRGEIFTFNEQTENRLVQIVGRIDNEGEPSLNVNDPIDYDMQASSRNIASEVGQHVLLFQRAQSALQQATADIAQFLEDIELEKRFLQDALQQHEKKTQVLAEYSVMQQNLDREIAKVVAKQTRLNAAAQAAVTAVQGQGPAKWVTGESFAAGLASAIQLANGMEQARLEEKKGELQADKTMLSYEERIKLTQIDTEIFKLQQTKHIEQMVNDVVLKDISAQMAEIDLQLALGQLNKFIAERDELLAQRGRSLANLGEMSFADPSFRLTQFNAMKDSETQLEFLKRWLYLMTRALYYKWAVQDDHVIRIQGLPDVGIHDVRRIQVVGALTDNISGTPLSDDITAADYVQALLTFNDAGPIRSITSPVSINRVNSNNSARYSLREDFLRIVRTEDTSEETQRVREAFRAWLTSPDRLDDVGNLVIAFDTIGHVENYNLPVNETRGDWTHFALRSFSSLPLWNHKITQIGVALKPVGLAFVPGVLNVTGSIEYGGIGYLKGDSDSQDDFRAYRMRQWRDLGNGRLEPVDVRTVGVTIPTSSALESAETTYMVPNLNERPVASTIWRLKILASQLGNIELGNIEDIYIYVYSKAYQRQ